MNENEKALTNDELKEVNGGSLPYDPNEMLKPLKPEYEKKDFFDEPHGYISGEEHSGSRYPSPEEN